MPPKGPARSRSHRGRVGSVAKAKAAPPDATSTPTSPDSVPSPASSGEDAPPPKAGMLPAGPPPPVPVNAPKASAASLAALGDGTNPGVGGVNAATIAPALVPSGPPVPDPASSAEISSATVVPVAHAAGHAAGPAPSLPGPSLSPGSTTAGATIPKAATPVQHYQHILAKTTPPVRPTAPKARPPAASTTNYVMPGWTITITFQPNP